jgi:hypothetical protein
MQMYNRERKYKNGWRDLFINNLGFLMQSCLLYLGARVLETVEGNKYAPNIF